MKRKSFGNKGKREYQIRQSEFTRTTLDPEEDGEKSASNNEGSCDGSIVYKTETRNTDHGSGEEKKVGTTKWIDGKELTY